VSGQVGGRSFLARDQRSRQPAPHDRQPRRADADLAGEDQEQRQERDPDEEAWHDELADRRDRRRVWAVCEDRCEAWLRTEGTADSDDIEGRIDTAQSGAGR
jgi:hypothetical protein